LSAVEFRVLGPLRVVDGDRAVDISSPRQRALLSLLLVHAGRIVSSERVLDELWGEEAPASGREAVAFHVSRLRRALGGVNGGPIETRDGGYVLSVDPAEVDASRFEQLAAAGHSRLATDAAGAADLLGEALALWHGEPFEGLADFPFTANVARRLEELRLRATEDQLEAALALGHHAAVVAALEELVGREPLRERLRGLLMVALYRSGRQADALRVYHDGRRVLAEELGIEPSPELVALEAAILRQDARLVTGPPLLAIGDDTASKAVSIVPHNPYKGLRAFGEADAGDFFGREALTTELVERLGNVARAAGLLAVVGPSGSGKSSVVRAGLVPALRAGALVGSERWPIATMLPGSRPFDELAAALRPVLQVGGRGDRLPGARRMADDPAALPAALAHVLEPDGRCVLVIDQLEELFTLASGDIVEAFGRTLASALETSAGQLLVVATLRADHLDAALRSPELGPLLRLGTEFAPPLDRAELERAIERPAAGAGLRLEPGLTDTILADVVGRPTMLPLLQYALTELVERAGDRIITKAGYEAIGGVLGALAGRAEETFDALEPEERTAARQVLLRMVAVEPTGEASGRRVLVGAYEDEALGPAVLERFGRARLVTHGRDARTGDATVEIAHEALLTRWPRLAAWIEQEREAIWLLRRLGEAADEWLAHDRDDGFLLTGGRLEMFASWAAATDLHLDAGERALLDASLAERRRSVEAEAARQANERRLERRATRWLQALVAVFALAAVASTALLAVVWRQSETAAEERAIATARQLAVAANGRLEADPGLALLLAIESARATADRGWITEQTMDALHWAIQAVRYPYPIEEGPIGVRMARDGTRGVYVLPPDELVELAQAGAWWREWHADECRAYLGVERCQAQGPVLTEGLRGVMTVDGVVPVARFVAASSAGSSVRVWSQLPIDAEGLLAPFASRTGTTVVLSEDDGSADLSSTIVRADVAILARPGDVADLTRPQFALDLRTILRSDEASAIAASPLADLGWVGGHDFGPDASGARLIGSPIAITASSLLWYPADAFARVGYAPPTNGTELRELEKRMIADGRTPWCVGLADRASGVDWVEDLALDSLAGEPPSSAGTAWLRFDGAAAASGFLHFRDLVASEGAVLGGRAAVIRRTNSAAAAQMSTGPEPDCWLIHATAVERTGWGGAVRSDLRPMPLPLGDDPTMMRGRVYVMVVLRDRPEVRALVRELLGTGIAATLAADAGGSEIVPLGPSAGTAWEAADGGLRAALVAALLADRVWVDASDLMQRDLGEVALPDAIRRVAEADGPTVGGLIEHELEALAELEHELQP
jgi:DNA-binding SARP family transcriptional activator